MDPFIQSRKVEVDINKLEREFYHRLIVSLVLIVIDILQEVCICKFGKRNDHSAIFGFVVIWIVANAKKAG